MRFLLPLLLQTINGIDTVEHYYSGTEGPVAIQRFDEHVLRLRERLARASSQRPKQNTSHAD